jgi:hypothetical protein
MAVVGRWSGGFPGNGSNVFMVWTSGSNARSQTVTNAPGSDSTADSLSITNTVSANNSSATVIFSGRAFFTNGVGQLTLAGPTSTSDLIVTFKTAFFVAAGEGQRRATGLPDQLGQQLALHHHQQRRGLLHQFERLEPDEYPLGGKSGLQQRFQWNPSTHDRARAERAVAVVRWRADRVGHRAQAHPTQR